MPSSQLAAGDRSIHDVDEHLGATGSEADDADVLAVSLGRVERTDIATTRPARTVTFISSEPYGAELARSDEQRILVLGGEQIVQQPRVWKSTSQFRAMKPPGRNPRASQSE